MAIPWGTIKTLLIFFGPMILPRVLAFYRSLTAPSTRAPIPLSSTLKVQLNLLAVSSLVFLLSSLPIFAPVNIFISTASRLQTPTNVLFTRLATITPPTPRTAVLREIFEAGGLEARLLYLRFGPTALETCTYVDPKAHDAATTLLLHAIPGLLGPHILHMLVLGLATAGRGAGRWRTLAAIAGVVLGVVDLLLVAQYDHSVNAKATRTAEVDMFFWKARIVRGIALAGVDAVLGWIIWMAGTRRAFVLPVSGAEKVEDITKVAEGTLGKLRAMGAVRNVVYRNTQMRAGVERYWVNEERVMGQLVEDAGVRKAMNEVLEGADMDKLQREAEAYVNAVVPATVELQNP